MWRSKKFIFIAVLAVVVLVGGIGGIVFAQTGDGEESQPEAQHSALLEKVSEIYNTANPEAPIDIEKLEAAFAQAKGEMREAALDQRLQGLVDEGQITQEQADQYKEWLQSKPDMEQFRQQQREWWQTKPGTPPEMEEWQKAKPDMPFPKSSGDRSFHGGMKRSGGRHFWGR